MDNSPEDSVNPARTAEAKAFHAKRARKSQKGAGKSSFVAIDGKVVKRTVMPNGNTHSVYVGTTKECDAQKIAYTKG